jgi:hypothetical protein
LVGADVEGRFLSGGGRFSVDIAAIIALLLLSAGVSSVVEEAEAGGAGAEVSLRLTLVCQLVRQYGDTIRSQLAVGTDAYRSGLGDQSTWLLDPAGSSSSHSRLKEVTLENAPDFAVRAAVIDDIMSIESWSGRREDTRE